MNKYLYQFFLDILEGLGIYMATPKEKNSLCDGGISMAIQKLQ